MVDCLKDLSLTRAETIGKLERLPEGTVVPSASGTRAIKQGHSFKWNGKMFVCSICLGRTASLAGRSSLSVLCSGPPAFAGLLELGGSNRHDLWSAGIKEGGVLLFCSRCYHYAAPHPRKLLAKCPGQPCSDASSEMFYLKRRRHPISRSRLFMPTKVV